LNHQTILTLDFSEKTSAAGNDAAAIRLRPLSQFERGEDWRLKTLHDRDDYTMVWITKGQGLGVISGIRRGVGAHTALLIPPKTLFTLELMRGASAMVLNMPASLANALNMPERPEILRLREVQQQGELTHRLEAIQREAQSDAPHAQDALTAHTALLSVALRRLLAAQPPTPRPNGALRLTEAYCALVSDHYDRGIGVNDFARMLGVTTPHLTRCCKEASGRSAIDILNERALYAARDLIERSDTTLKQIAEKLHFGSAAYFSRYISKHTGKSPSALRKSVQQAKPTSPAANTGLSKSASISPIRKIVRESRF
jgi:AraC family transcriptional activator of pobA